MNTKSNNVCQIKETQLSYINDGDYFTIGWYPNPLTASSSFIPFPVYQRLCKEKYIIYVSSTVIGYFDIHPKYSSNYKPHYFVLDIHKIRYLNRIGLEFEAAIGPGDNGDYMEFYLNE